MPSKPDRYGIKFWSLTDVETAYLLDLDIYLGKPSHQTERNKEVGKNVVINLVKKYNYTGRVITTDNFFTSVNLAQELWSKGLKLVGTLRANKTEIPIEFRPHKDKAVDSSIFGFNEYLTLVSFVPKPKKSVILLSSHHHLNIVDTDSRGKTKSWITLFYNRTKCGVDRLDQLVSNYTCNRRTERWTLRVFMFLVDVAAYNAFVLFKTLNPNAERRDVLEELGKTLIKPFIETRLNKIVKNNFKYIKKSILDSMRQIGIEIPFKESSKQRFKNNCQVCSHATRNKTDDLCLKCKLFVCNKHNKKIILCNGCYKNKLTWKS